MKKIITLSLFAMLIMAQAAVARIIEVDVHGMTCPFCVDSLERKFSQLDAVSDIQVSLKMKKIRLETSENAPSMEVIKQTILDAGFMPTNIQVIPEDGK